MKAGAERSGGERPSASHFVVLDGVDGCGKTTQALRLVGYLADAAEARGAEAPLHLREPGSTVAGERIRELVLAPDVALDRGALAMLFAAARRQTLVELVAPALAAGRDVVIERFHASTFAYQGQRAADAGSEVGSGVGSEVGSEVAPFDDEQLVTLLRGWAGVPTPTVEIVLDLSPTEAFERALARDGGGTDRFESRGLAFQEGVAAAMRRYVELVPTARLVSATGDPSEVADRVLDAIGLGAIDLGESAQGPNERGGGEQRG